MSAEVIEPWEKRAVFFRPGGATRRVPGCRAWAPAAVGSAGGGGGAGGAEGAGGEAAGGAGGDGATAAGGSWR